MKMVVPIEPLPPGTELGEWVLAAANGGDRPSTIVYQATRREDGFRAVIKEYALARAGVAPVAKPDETLLRQGLRAFAGDAHLLSTLPSPNRVPGLVVVRSLIKANGTVYAVMDLEPGTPLSAMLERGERPGEAWLRARLREIATGLIAAHEVGVLHRAIEPADIIVAPDGGATLVGFCSHSGRANRDAANGDHYAAPEQRSSDHAIGPWTDIYALGAVLHHCVTGVAPAGEFDRLADRDLPGFERGFLAAIDAATASDPAQRPQTVADWLEQFAMVPLAIAKPRPDAVALGDASPSVEGSNAERVIADRRPVVSGPASSAIMLPPVETEDPAPQPRPAPGRRVVMAAAAAAALVLAIVLFVLLTGRREGAVDTAALDRELRGSRATIEAIDLDARQIAVDGVPLADAMPAFAVTAQARRALERQTRARAALERAEDRAARAAARAEFDSAGAAIARAELAALQRAIAAYGIDTDRRSQNFDATVREVRMALAEPSTERNGEAIASRIDVIWPLFTRSRAQLRRLMAERLSATTAANARQLLREVKLAYHANSEARANLDGLVIDGRRVIERERLDREAFTDAQRELRQAIAASRAAAGSIVAMSRTRARANDPRLAALAAEARRRAAGLGFIDDLADAGDLPTIRAALAEARVGEAGLRAMLAEARGLPRATSVDPARASAPVSAARETSAPPPVFQPRSIVQPATEPAEPVVVTSNIRAITRRTARDLDATSDRYRELRRDLTRAYRARGAASGRNARDFAEADRVYAALLNLGELKRVTDAARSPAQAELAYRDFSRSRQRVEARLDALRSSLSQR